MKGAHTDERGKAENKDSKNPRDVSDETKREGPPRVPHELDRQEKWDEASRHRGYQSGDQGGYKGDYDQGKYENRDFGFPPGDESKAGKQDDAGPARSYPGQESAPPRKPAK